MKKAVLVLAPLATGFLLAGFAFLAVRNMMDPVQASSRFGFPVHDAAGALFFRVYLSRNLVLAAAGFAFLLHRMWKPLAMFVTACIALPVFDIAVLEAGKVSPIPAFHSVAIVSLAAVSILLWMRARDAAA